MKTDEELQPTQETDARSCIDNLVCSDFARRLERERDQARRELSELREATSWRPIETAPKDGREVLLFERWTDVPFVGYWGERENKWEAHRSHYTVKGDGVVKSSLCQSDILHWMPLPKPPTF